MSLLDLLKQAIFANPSNPFDEFVSLLNNLTTRPAHSLAELRNVAISSAVKGSLFEDFCVAYLLNIQEYSKVWKIAELPPEIRESLGLPVRDMRIDLIAEDCIGRFSAVQVKFRKYISGFVPGKKIRLDRVNWQDLSTFYALCARTGPYHRHIVMTNALGVNRQGGKGEKDISICGGTFKSLTVEDFRKMLAGLAGKETIEKSGRRLGISSSSDSSHMELSIEEVRTARLARFGKG